MAYFTESQLREYGASSELEKRASRFMNESRASARVSMFLSHSHKDRLAVKGLINHLGSLGIDVYVDWNDADMPRETSRETADQIKRKIEQNALFVVLATHNAMDSKWVPWEIGVADKTKGEDRVLILPVADASGRFEGIEYLQLYRRIVIATDGETAVFEPNRSEGGSEVKTFMESRGR